MNPKKLRKPKEEKNFTFEFPLEFINMGSEMSEIYYNLFVFENFLRLFIEQIAKDEYSTNFLKKLNINKKISEKINERKEEEKNKKWMSIRGDSDLFYTDLLDLKTIISSNWDLFRHLFPKEQWITSKLEELYDLRNKVAHNSYLDFNEQQTASTYITNIYSQLRVDLEYKAFREMEYHQDDDMEEFYEPDDIKFKEIDYEKINKYTSMIDTGEIAPDMIRSALHSIYNELRKITLESDFNKVNLDTVKSVCVVINNFIQDKDDNIQRRALEVLSPLKRNEETKNIVKKYCYETFKSMLKQGKSHATLLQFSDSFGYFQNIEEVLSKAIDNKEIELLGSYRAFIDFTKFKNIRFELIKVLNEKLKTLAPEDKSLKEIIVQLIEKIG